MSEQDGRQAPTIQRPATNDPDAWKAYWQAQGQQWRTEPEIDAERQKYLTDRRRIKPDIEQGIYSFKGIKLSRADIEWLLATHENSRGPVDWGDERQRGRKGLDLRGSDLSDLDLTYLPLARMVGGIYEHEWNDATEKQRDNAAVRMQRAKFSGAHLEGAYLDFAHMEGAQLRFTYLDRAHFRGTSLIGADLRETYMLRARLQDAVLSDERHIGPRLVDAELAGANLAFVNWTQIEILGDENEALQKKVSGKIKDKRVLFAEFEVAVRANRQLAIALQAQGLNEHAAHFAYRAQKLERAVFLHQRKFGKYLFSGFLDLLTGYGYKPLRSFLAYLLVITAFATAYFIIGRTAGPSLSPIGSVVLSMTSFHGRGFFPGGIALDDPLTILAALEALVGLLIEVSFIATLTQRLFGK